jgi:hypothetical protein
MSSTVSLFKQTARAGTIEKRESASRSFTQPGASVFSAIVNGIKQNQGNYTAIVPQIGFEPGQGTGNSANAPDSISVTLINTDAILPSTTDRINPVTGQREFEVAVKADPAVTGYFAQRADDYAAGTLPEEETAIFDLLYDSEQQADNAKDLPALVKRHVHMAMPAAPSVEVTDVKLFKGNKAGLKTTSIKAGDLVDIKNARFCLYVCAPKAKRAYGAKKEAAPVPVPVETAATDGATVSAAAAKIEYDPPVLMYSISASSITFSDNNYAGSLAEKLSAYFPRDRLALCGLPTSPIASAHLVVHLGDVQYRGPHVVREEDIPTDASIYLKAPRGETLESTPAREMHGRRSIMEMPYESDPLAERLARTAFFTVADIELWREQCVALTGITRNEDWVKVAQLPWRATVLAKLNVADTRACDANKGDVRAQYDVNGTLKLKVALLVPRLGESLEAFGVQVSPQFAYQTWPDAHMTAMQHGKQVNVFDLKNQHWPNPLHDNRAALQIINLNEFTGSMGTLVDASRIFAVCDRRWSEEELAQLKAMTMDERERVLRQTEDAPLKLAPGTRLQYLLYAVTPHYDAAVANAAKVPLPAAIVKQ